MSKRTRKSLESQIAETGVTADLLVELRDDHGMSWEAIAEETGLTNAGSAKAVYVKLVGDDPSGTTAKTRAKRGSGGGRTRAVPEWNDDSDPDEVEEAIAGHTIHVRRPYRNDPEEIRVKSVQYFDWETPSGESVPMTVTLVDQQSGGLRSVRVSDVVRVTR